MVDLLGSLATCECHIQGYTRNNGMPCKAPPEITPEMLERGTEAFISWKAYNADALELGGLGDVSALMAAIWPIFENSCKSSSDRDSND